MQNAIAMFMNIHARFIFENNFYLARQKGLVAEEDITELMLAAQKKATKIVLAVIILISGRANCTSLLMMCLSIISHILLAIYSAWVSMRMPINKALFEDQYIALLRDTASMTSEELAKNI